MQLELKATGRIQTPPTTITFNFNFKEKSQDYTEVINKGAQQIISFKSILKKLNILEENFKTKSYNIQSINKRVEENKGIIDREKTTRYVFSHYEITQSATLTLDFDMKVMLSLISEISKMKNYPTYTFNFGIKDKEKTLLEDKALSDAIKLAEQKANAVRIATNNENISLQDIEIVEEFKAFGNDYRSRTMMKVMECEMNFIDTDNLSTTITPEDIFVEISILARFKIY